MNKFDCIVVGGGHAGCEAAVALARLGAKVLLTSINLDNIALMPCNPAIGGPAKSCLVREIDALGGIMGEAADATYVQLKMLNASKGPAVRALRAQSDKKEYMNYVRNLIENEKNIFLKQTVVTELMVDNAIVTGIRTELGEEFSAKSVILTTGTSLNGKIYVGLQSFEAGRLAEKSAKGLSESLEKYEIYLKKLKTGTPARVDSRTIDFSNLIIQPGDENPHFFSFKPNRPVRAQIPCYLTRTNEKTHEIIRNNLDKSPMYSGLIKGVGPRYCPSIEDKIIRFAHNPSHHIFIEPEGKNTYETYVQGFSTSLPINAQILMLRSLPGLENVHVMKPAYAVEYDYVPAVQLEHSLMTKKIKGLFCAGQINGTSGYEEAAAQGLVAGINAFKYLNNQDLITFPRSESYIGTLIDDLVTKDIDEPYRMLTSRSEYRLILRQDNADTRLTPIGKSIGLIDENRYKYFLEKQSLIEKELERLRNTNILAESKSVMKKIRIAELLKRPEISYETLLTLDEDTKALNLPRDVYEQVEIIVKYDGYIKRQQEQIDMAGKLEDIIIPDDLDYYAISHISTETKDKLSKIRPKTLAQAMRVGGVKPADISVLMVLLK